MIPLSEEKEIGTLMLRHIIISHFNRNNNTIHKQEAFSNNCMHSSAQNRIYRVM